MKYLNSKLKVNVITVVGCLTRDGLNSPLCEWSNYTSMYKQFLYINILSGLGYSWAKVTHVKNWVWIIARNILGLRALKT